jgi:signal-transduction protein with cAMP-binding, CBS, and nucleotidyltransferase domain
MSSQEAKLRDALQFACETSRSILDAKFLCQSIGSLNPASPMVVSLTTPLLEVRELLSAGKSGAVLVIDASERLTGIFTERDLVQKCAPHDQSIWSRPIEELMTRDPVAEPPETSVAYALNLMSVGGFRHLPIIDDDKRPVGIFSVKDLIDSIVAAYTDSLLSAEIP